jgi:hypothetical protein
MSSMAEFDFPPQSFLIDDVKRPDGSYFFERGKKRADGSPKSAFQRQHIQPQEDMASARGRAFVDRISSVEDARYRFNGADFGRNGSALPFSYNDAMRLGMVAHRGSHPGYTQIVAQYREDVFDRARRVEQAKKAELLAGSETLSEAEAQGRARQFADDFMAKEWKGVINTLRMAFQVGGLPGIGDRRPGLVMHNDDPWVRAAGYSTAAEYNQGASNKIGFCCGQAAQ